MILKPTFVVADEPVSMLDVSIRAQLLHLMFTLKEELNVTYLFITHDLSVTRYTCDRIAIMYVGSIVEIGPTEDLIKKPAHPYTELLLSSVPIPDPCFRRKPILRSFDIFDSESVAKGCRFYPRCPHAEEICKNDEPKLVEVGKDHFAACHLLGR